MLNKQDTGTSSLLSRLVSLTTIRDIELFEVSLLKTLTELLKIKQISMYKLNHSDATCWLAIYSTNLTQDSNKKRFFESREIYTSEIDVPDEIKSAKLWIDSTKKPYLFNQGNQFSVVYPIFGIEKIESLLAFQLSHALTEGEMVIITSLLSITYNFRSLLSENQKDKLTGLLNRQTFDESINKIQSLNLNMISDLSDDKWMMQDRREYDKDQERFFLAIIDIDDFKSVNDQFGHIMGDEVLLLISHLMKQAFRAKDLLFRFGGEEFIVLIQSQDKEEAYKVLERFRNKIEGHRFPQINRVTVSIGATVISGAHFFAADIIGRADKALYHAKKNGKNQLHFYEDLLSEGHIIEKLETGAIDFF